MAHCIKFHFDFMGCALNSKLFLVNGLMKVDYVGFTRFI